MALLGSFTKQPREVLDCDIDYSAVLAGRTDTIASQVAEVSPSGAGALSAATPTRSGNVVKVVVSGGLTNTPYKLTILATTTAGLVYEDEVTILVEEV
jgi:hypothetical protein